MKKARRRGRELALHALYAYELSQNPVEQVIADIIRAEADSDFIKQFAEQLVDKAIGHADELDALIKRWSHNWEFDRIAIIDKLILRIAISEFLHFEDIPPKVSIDEAIEIAKKYSTEKSGKFINGILDAILSDLRQDDRIHKSGRGLLDGS
ncbi:MAG: transcription antitermination factor NusB [candidate division KSB1 bacterium]|nr:transcription antitermination factor NusB [candidate division KSB1 bacterium]MDZ7340180.1 transcription antitermination factor NusB [candidate division KSB1 bacterium]